MNFESTVIDKCTESRTEQLYSHLRLLYVVTDLHYLVDVVIGRQRHGADVDLYVIVEELLC